MGVAAPATPVDRFAHLEAALEEACRVSLFEAKKLEKIDPPAAVARMREYKGFQQELAVLKSTRSTNGEPASFRYSTTVTVQKKHTTYTTISINSRIVYVCM